MDKKMENGMEAGVWGMYGYVRLHEPRSMLGLPRDN